MSRLVMENEEHAEGDRVSLMTLHGAKGLEFDTVFLPGWEEGLFPSQRSMDESGNKGLEEERRLAYVGLTRARRRAIVSHAANRRIYANWQSSIPSRFIEELPEEHVERTGSAALARERAIDRARPSFAGQFPLAARGARARCEAWEQPGAAGARGGDPGGRAGVPPEIRLRHGHRGRRRQARHRVREGRRQARARPVRGARVTRRRAIALETICVDVPEEALAAYEAALQAACDTRRLLPRMTRPAWRVEGVKPRRRRRR